MCFQKEVIPAIKKFKNYLIGAAIIMIIGLAIRGHLIERYYEFDGIVEKISYEEPKHTPTITVNGKEYTFVYNNRALLDSIKSGDSLIKLKGDDRIRMIRKAR